MTEPKPTRWWRKKRTIATAVLWLALPILYFLAEGPLAFLEGVEPVSDIASAAQDFLYPGAIDDALAYCPVLADLRMSYLDLWNVGVHIYDVEFRWEPPNHPAD